jgi:hypothetical protein
MKKQDTVKGCSFEYESISTILMAFQLFQNERKREIERQRNK